MNMKNGIIIGVVVAVVVAGAGWFAYTNLGAKKVNDTNSVKVVKNVVARVNGVEISKTELDTVVAQLTKAQGTASSTEASKAKIKVAAINALVGQELLKQGLKASGIVATKEDVDKQISAAKKQFKTEEDFTKALTTQNITLEKLRAQFAQNIAMQKYLVSKLGDKKPTVTEAEVKAAYKKAIVGVAKPPTLKKAENNINNIKVFLLQQKQRKLINGVIDSLRAKAKIEIL